MNIKRLIRVVTLMAVTLRLRGRDEEELTPEEYGHLDAALGDALRADGSVDFSKLHEKSHPFDIDTWLAEASREDAPLATLNRGTLAH